MKHPFPGLVKVAVLLALSLSSRYASGATFLRGDADQSGTLDLTDAVTVIDSLFLGAGALPCLDSGDADDSGELDLTDPIQLLSFLFLGGGPPPPPYPLCGDDPTPDALRCDRSQGPPDCPAGPGESCGNVVGRALESGCGRVFAWGDEHVTFDENWPAVEPFWINTLTWLAEITCGRPRTRVWLGGLSRRQLPIFIQSLGLEVLEHAAGLDEVDIFIGSAEMLTIVSGPEKVRPWVEEGGALMTIVTGYPDGRQDLCERANSPIFGLGLAYDCLHQSPRGPVTEFGDHPLAAGLAPENAPFRNGTFVTEKAGTQSAVVARVGDCHPQEVGDCRNPVPFNGPHPDDSLEYESDCRSGPFGGINLPTGEVELNVIGLYEPDGGVHVRVERTAPMVLVLSSRDTAVWFLDPSPGTQILKVILNGYREQTGAIPPDIPYENFDAGVNGNYLGAGYGNDCGGGDTAVMVPALESLTGLPLRSFFGCYRAGQVTLR